jgi:hypothetical protein
VVGIPGGGKTYEQFTGDDANCRQSAADEVGPVPGTAPVSFGDMQRHYDFAYSQCMIARGNTVQVPPPPPVVVYDAYPFGAPYPMFYGGYNYAPHYYRRY